MNIDPIIFTRTYLERMEKAEKKPDDTPQVQQDTFAWYDPSAKSVPARPPSLTEFDNDIAEITKTPDSDRTIKQYLGMSLLTSIMASTAASSPMIAAPLYMSVAATVGKELIPSSMDMEITADSAKQLIASSGICKDSALNERARNVASSLLEHSPLKSQNMEIIVLDSDNVNAHALPGKIFVTKGLLADFESDGQLALFLGHEIAHAEDRDSMENVGRSMFEELAVSYTLMKSKVQLEGTSWNIGDIRKELKNTTTADSLSFDRNNETTADFRGTQLLLKAGYGLDDALTAMEKICNIEYNTKLAMVKNNVVKELGYLDESEVERRMAENQKFDSHPSKEARMNAVRLAAE